MDCPDCGLPTVRVPGYAGDLCDCWLDDADEMGLLPGDESDDDSEPVTWLKLWAIARSDLGLGIDEFGCLSEAQLDALLERRIEFYRRTTGTVAAAIYNANPFRGKDSDPISAFDFFPGAKPRARTQSVDEQIRVLTSVMGVGPGKTTVH